MINGKSILAIIPARGGSKGMPRKNIRDLCGKPLLAWTIEEAKTSKYIDRLIISSEDDEIIAVAKQWGCEVPFVRPQQLAQDETSGMEPIFHAIESLQEKYHYVVLLQVTSPLRIIDDIDGCIEWCNKQQAKSCVAVSEVAENPYWMYTIGSDGQLNKFVQTDIEYARRQDLPTAYIPNGAMYIAETAWFLENRGFEAQPHTIGYIMPQERAVDIDRELDFAVCELMKKGSAGGNK
jgi:CMP-N,N'-diacetyllegionaminic acid synthase